MLYGGHLLLSEALALTSLEMVDVLLPSLEAIFFKDVLSFNQCSICKRSSVVKCLFFAIM
jgi:hypothetical protein